MANGGCAAEAHDKLSDHIDKFDAAGMVNEPAVQALRAVVGLHKPDQPDSPNDYENCVECSGNGYLAMYPCPTIQAIEKELE